MFKDAERHGLVLTTALACLLAPSLAFSATRGRESTTRFLSADGKVLPDDWAIDLEAPSYVVIPGFLGSGTNDEYLRQAAAIGQRFPEANVVIVDWRPPPKPDPAKWTFLGYLVRPRLVSVLSGLTNTAREYQRWMKHAKHVGRDVAEWMKERGILPSRTVIVGHSLGAQVGAFASNECTKSELFGQPVYAILASDPAGPLFQGQPPEKRLDNTDARDVIVVHTTAVFGDESAIGTVDIYVSWPRSRQKEPNYVWQHNQAKKLVTASFLHREMSNTDGTPFGANALGFDFGDGRPRTFQPDSELKMGLASIK